MADPWYSKESDGNKKTTEIFTKRTRKKSWQNVVRGWVKNNKVYIRLSSLQQKKIKFLSVWATAHSPTPSQTQLSSRLLTLIDLFEENSLCILCYASYYTMHHTMLCIILCYASCYTMHHTTLCIILHYALYCTMHHTILCIILYHASYYTMHHTKLCIYAYVLYV